MFFFHSDKFILNVFFYSYLLMFLDVFLCHIDLNMIFSFTIATVYCISLYWLQRCMVLYSFFIGGFNDKDYWIKVSSDQLYYVSTMNFCYFTGSIHVPLRDSQSLPGFFQRLCKLWRLINNITGPEQINVIFRSNSTYKRQPTQKWIKLTTIWETDHIFYTEKHIRN